MKGNIHKAKVPAFTIVAVTTFLSSAQAEINFLSGGYAELCSLAAEKSDAQALYAVTGSNLGLSAIEVCTRAIQTRDGSISNRAESYNNRGVLYFENSNYGLALADFDAAISTKPMLAQAHLNRGYTLAAMQRWQDSIDALNRGLELGAAGQARAYFNRGIAHEELGNVRQAYLDYQRAAELDPGWAEPRRELERFTIRRSE